jgi:hypothetical protein
MTNEAEAHRLGLVRLVHSLSTAPALILADPVKQRVLQIGSVFEPARCRGKVDPAR